MTPLTPDELRRTRLVSIDLVTAIVRAQASRNADARVIGAALADCCAFWLATLDAKPDDPVVEDFMQAIRGMIPVNAAVVTKLREPDLP